MASNEQPTSSATDASGHQSHVGSQPHTQQGSASRQVEAANETFISSAYGMRSESYYGGQGAGLFADSSHSTAVPSPEIISTPDAANNHISDPVRDHEAVQHDVAQNERREGAVEEAVVLQNDSSDSDREEAGGFAAIKSVESGQRPALQSRQSKPMTEDDLFRVLSRRRTNQSNALGKTNTAATASSKEEEDEINNLMSKMFGRTRQEGSEEEKTRHHGVIFKNLTVKGMGIGAALQPSVGDFFLNPGRLIKNLISKGPRKAAGKPPVRTIIDDFSGCIRPGEMILVLGRPGAGCSTFLKIIGNQRFGFEKITGDVTYGGTDAEEMHKQYRSEVLYNPEDDLHYATLKVKDTLRFALKTKTPGKASRKEGESRKDYVNEFLRVVTKLFWIEHTLGTKVSLLPQLR